MKLNTVHKVKRFREKPNMETAEQYLASGKHIWNSGTFLIENDRRNQLIDLLARNVYFHN